MKAARLRRGDPDDAICIALLSMHVFLDTYATQGIRPDLAREALAEYSPARFGQRLIDATRSFILAEVDEGLVGFAEMRTTPAAVPVQGNSTSGLELVRLYILPSVQRTGLGRRLLEESERACRRLGCGVLWLTAWSGNTRALAFYRALGYADKGATNYMFQGNTYENRVLAKELTGQSEAGIS